jgi:hypothetical protein
MEMPLSEDALRFARKLAASKYTCPDDRLAVADLLKRWNLGLGSSLAERRMALRLSREAALLDETEIQDDEVATLPSVARVLATAQPPAAEEGDETIEEPDPETGDDDAEEDLDDYAGCDFYADALEAA